VPIICGVHSQKDQINLLGCERFAKDTNQKLVNFYSIDKWGKEKDPSIRKKSKGKSKVIHKSSEIDFDTQREIWKVHHGGTENFAGKLPLCIGMPVMLRNNDATELCITKGQEGFVVGWQSSTADHGKHVLDTLFVELQNPPKLVQIPSLPDNVVPIVKNTKTIQCVFPSDLKESIERQQVWVLPNFAMTAHAAQGKTRPYNVVHLNSCFSHMAYYSSLSRSATAAGTVIIQGFDNKMITRGCSGYLRQEFRELELLDDITRMRYEGSLPEHIKQDDVRSSMIKKFQQWKGTAYVPSKTDAALKWTNSDPLVSLDLVEDSPWHMVDKNSKNKSVSTVTSCIPAKGSISCSSKKHMIETGVYKQPVNMHFVPAKGSQAVTSQLKRKCQESCKEHISKKNKIAVDNMDNSVNSLIGPHWDSNNWSCAYDSLFVILYNIWAESPVIWTTRFQSIQNTYLLTLVEGFHMMHQDESISFENARDNVRAKLHAKYPTEFPTGQLGTSAVNLSMELLKPIGSVAYSQVVCLNCQHEGPKVNDKLNYVIHVDSSISDSTSNCMQQIGVRVRNKCPNCNLQLMQQIQYTTLPNLLVLEYSTSNIVTSHEIWVKVNDELKALHLRGIVYYGGYHFTSRFISECGTAWYHDGITTGGVLHRDRDIKSILDVDMRRCAGKDLIFAIYAPK